MSASLNEQLIEAVKRGDEPSVIADLITQGASVFAKTSDRGIILHIPNAYKYLSIWEEHTQSRQAGWINSVNMAGQTVLHAAFDLLHPITALTVANDGSARNSARNSAKIVAHSNVPQSVSTAVDDDGQASSSQPDVASSSQQQHGNSDDDDDNTDSRGLTILLPHHGGQIFSETASKYPPEEITEDIRTSIREYILFLLRIGANPTLRGRSFLVPLLHRTILAGDAWFAYHILKTKPDYFVTDNNGRNIFHAIFDIDYGTIFPPEFFMQFDGVGHEQSVPPLDDPIVADRTRKQDQIYADKGKTPQDRNKVNHVYPPLSKWIRQAILEVYDSDGMTPFMIALHNKPISTILSNSMPYIAPLLCDVLTTKKLLLPTKGCSIPGHCLYTEKRVENDITCIQELIDKCDKDAIKQLLSSCYLCDYGVTPLFHAFTHSNPTSIQLDWIRYILSYQPDLNNAINHKIIKTNTHEQYKYGNIMSREGTYTFLHRLSSDVYIPIVQGLIEGPRGQEIKSMVNIIRHGETPLLTVARMNHLNTERYIGWLIEHSTSTITVTNPKGCNILHLLLRHKKYENVLKILLSHIDIEQFKTLVTEQDSQGYPPLKSPYSDSKMVKLVQNHVKTLQCDDVSSIEQQAETVNSTAVQVKAGSIPPDSIDNIHYYPQQQQQQNTQNNTTHKSDSVTPPATAAAASSTKSTTNATTSTDKPASTPAPTKLDSNQQSSGCCTIM